MVCANAQDLQGAAHRPKPALMRTFETATRSDWITDRALRAIIATAMALPYKQRVRWFGAMAQRLVAPSAGYLKRSREQISMIWPDMDAAEVDRLARACCNNFGRTMIEGYSRDDYTAQLAGTVPQGEGLEPLAKAKSEGP